MKPADLATVQSDTEAIVPICDAVDLPAKNIRAEVATYFNVPLDWMCSPRRWQAVARPRMVAMYLCRRLLAMSFPDIGRVFQRDHSTVVSAVRKMERTFEEDSKAWRDIMNIERKLLTLAGRLRP